MNETEFYEKLLGVSSPWFVEDVELNMEGGRVEVRLNHVESGQWCCPECETIAPLYDHASERTWRHLDTCHLMTLLKTRLPRVECPSCGVRQVEAPWAEPGGRFTLMMESFIVRVIEECQTITGAARLMGISWDAAMGVMRRATTRGLARRKAAVSGRIGVDEKAFKKRHRYMTLVYDLDSSAVLYVGEGRKQESLSRYYDSLEDEELESIEAVAMDMWQPYIGATTASVPDASEKIVFDRFHIAKHAGDAVDKVRREEHRKLMAGGDDILKSTRYDWLTSLENLRDERLENFAKLQEANLKTSRAWAIKETLRELWDQPDRERATKFFKKWFGWAVRSRLKSIVSLARMLKRHLDNIVTYCTHRITNAVAEGVNSKIMSIKRQSSGFKNTENFKTAIYFYCGNLSKDPLEIV